MKVILLADVKALGKKGDVVEVSEGYARNMLLKKKLGKEATGANLNDLKLQNQNAEKIAQENYEAAVEFAKEIEEWKVETSIKTGKDGRSFGSVSTKEIAEAAKKQYGKDIDKKKIILEDPIKALGLYEVKIKLHPKVMATLKVHVAEA
ncbi:MAG: 50S ribosomal protein L9 [Pseudobutyrivibrio sp.]|nr:50S ribosomal protein L9 [Pseudobutyrivibrio sp.]